MGLGMVVLWKGRKGWSVVEEQMKEDGGYLSSPWFALGAFVIRKCPRSIRHGLTGRKER